VSASFRGNRAAACETDRKASARRDPAADVARMSPRGSEICAQAGGSPVVRERAQPRPPTAAKAWARPLCGACPRPAAPPRRTRVAATDL